MKGFETFPQPEASIPKPEKKKKLGKISKWLGAGAVAAGSAAVYHAQELAVSRAANRVDSKTTLFHQTSHDVLRCVVAGTFLDRFVLGRTESSPFRNHRVVGEHSQLL